jgi:hypothetical protein
VGCVPGSLKEEVMKTDPQNKIGYIGFVLTMVVTSASTIVATKYPDYFEYAEWGLYIYVALLLVAGFFLIRKKNAA